MTVGQNWFDLGENEQAATRRQRMEADDLTRPEPLRGTEGPGPEVVGDWRDDARCAGTGPELFFSERGDNAGLELARKVCMDCPVRLDCLEYALEAGERWGMWGGLSERQRKRVRALRDRRKPVDLTPRPEVVVCVTCGGSVRRYAGKNHDRCSACRKRSA